MFEPVTGRKLRNKYHVTQSKMMSSHYPSKYETLKSYNFFCIYIYIYTVYINVYTYTQEID